MQKYDKEGQMSFHNEYSQQAKLYENLGYKKTAQFLVYFACSIFQAATIS